jgi:hypothetical protein
MSRRFGSYAVLRLRLTQAFQVMAFSDRQCHADSATQQVSRVVDDQISRDTPSNCS